MLGALTVPPPKPGYLRGFVVQARYVEDTTQPVGRLRPFVVDDQDYDLRFREFYPNGFATRTGGAQDLHESHLQAGFDSRILPGAAFLGKGDTYEFLTEH